MHAVVACKALPWHVSGIKVQLIPESQLPYLLPGTAAATCSWSQEFETCCPKVNTFGPDGPFAPKSASEYYYGSRSGHQQQGTAVQWPSAAQPAQPSLVAYCNWTNPYIDDTFVLTPDLTTGVMPTAFVDGTW